MHFPSVASASNRLISSLIVLIGILEAVKCTPGITYGIKIHVHPPTSRGIDLVCGSSGYSKYYYQSFNETGMLSWSFTATESDPGWYCQAHLSHGCLKRWHNTQDPPGAPPNLPWCEPFLVYGEWHLNPTVGESVPTANNVWTVDMYGKRRTLENDENVNDFESSWDFNIFKWKVGVKKEGQQVKSQKDPQEYYKRFERGNGI